MGRLIDILIIGVQVGLTFVTTVCIYMFFALMDYQGGFDSFVGMTIFQPVIAAVFSGLTIFFCAVLGLPIRLIKSVKKWWTQHFYIAIGLTLLGLTFLILSLTPHFIQQTTIMRDELEIAKSIPHFGLAITGWFLTAFFILHTYPPDRLLRKAQNIRHPSKSPERDSEDLI